MECLGLEVGAEGRVRLFHASMEASDRNALAAHRSAALPFGHGKPAHTYRSASGSDPRGRLSTVSPNDRGRNRNRPAYPPAVDDGRAADDHAEQCRLDRQTLRSGTGARSSVKTGVNADTITLPLRAGSSPNFGMHAANIIASGELSVSATYATRSRVAIRSSFFSYASPRSLALAGKTLKTNQRAGRSQDPIPPARRTDSNEWHEWRSQMRAAPFLGPAKLKVLGNRATLETLSGFEPFQCRDDIPRKKLPCRSLRLRCRAVPC